MIAVMLATACGSATPLGDTSGDDDSTSSTTVMVTSNDGENTTVQFTTDDTGASSTDTGSSSSPTGDTSTTETTGSSTSEGSSDTSTHESSSGSSESTTESSDCIEMSGCEAGCQIEFECGVGEWESAQECTDWCEANLVKAEAFACFCAQAWNTLSTCFGGLTCEEYAEYLEPTMFPYPCSIESDSLMFECEGQ